MSKPDRFAPSIPWVLFLMLMVFFCVFPRLLIAPLLLRIADEFDVGFDAASRLFLTVSTGFIIGLFASGFVARRITHRWTVTGSVALAGAMMIASSLAPSLSFLHATLFSLGFANGLYPGSGVASVAGMVPDLHRGKALAIHESGPNLAFIVAPLATAALAPFVGWRGVMAVAGAASVLVALSFGSFGRADRARGEPPHFRNIGVIARNRSFWVVSFLLAISSVGAMGVYSELPTYLIVEHALDETLVNTVIGASRIIAFAAILSAGALSDRFGFRAVVLVIMGLTGVATIMIGLTSGSVLLVGVFIQPAVVGAFFPVGVRELTEIVAPKTRNLAVALAIPPANLAGGGIAPFVLSAVGAAGGFRAGFVVLGLMIIASIATLPLMGGARAQSR